jgi:prepilin peptidase CpaA
MILFIIVFCMMVAIGFGIAAAISDFRSMTIPNLYAGCIVLAFIPAYLADAFTGNGVEFFSSWKGHLIAAAVMFVITFLLFTARVIGAGDSKLCSAFALWTGLTGLGPYLFYMAILGAVLGIATKLLAHRKLVAEPHEGSWIAKSQAGEMGVPYGIAICFGAIVAFYLLGYFSPEKLTLLAGYTENQQ